MTADGWPRVSVVISTLDRIATLPTTLESLRWLSYPGEFEVVVVAGPSTDGTDAHLASWGEDITVVRCPEANLSRSRNLGIAAAAGEIIAFIDDDAVPEPEWLAELITAYDDPRVGAAGGFVVDHTGIGYQSTFSSFNRLGDPIDSYGLPASGLVFPFSFAFPHLIGTNTSFRRSALEAVGGFDEEIEYFLDDTDVVVRVMDRGHGIEQVAGAHVHHKFAPSHIRGPARVARNRYSVIKNRTYFSSRHASPFLDPVVLRRDQEAFADEHRRQIARAVDDGVLDPEALTEFHGYRDRALERGRDAAARGAPLVVDRDWRESETPPFRSFETRVPRDGVDRRIRIVRARERERAVRRAQLDAAEGLVVHMVEPTSHPAHVDFVDGVWRHRVPVTDHHWGRAAEAEAERIAARFPSATR